MTKDQARQQLEAALEAPLPADQVERDKLYQDLSLTRPELQPLINRLLEPDNLPLPEEAEATKAARRERQQATVQKLFYSPSPSGESALNKRKVLGVITGLLMLTLPVAFIAQQMHGAQAVTPTQEIMVLEPVVPLTPGEPIPAWPEEEELWEPAPVTPATPAPAAPVQQPVVAAPPLVRGAQNLPPTPGPVNPAIAGAPPQWGSAQPAPASAATPPQPLVRYEQPPQARLPLSAFNAPPQPRPPIAAYTAPPRAAALSVAPQQPPATERAPSTAFAAPRRDQLPLMAAPAQAAPAALTVMTAAPAARQTEQATTPTSWVAPAATPTATAPVTVFARPPLAEAAPAAAAPAPTAAPTAAPPVQFARPGDRIPAQLTTGIALVEGANAPVVAETPAGAWCPATPCPAVVWLGEASLDGANRVSISFTQAIIDGQVRPVSGLALGLDHLPGLAANLRDATPTAALDLVRAAAGGVSDYVQALIDRRQVIIRDGQQIITDLGPPPLGQVVGGRLAQLFQLPTGQTAVVRVAEVPFATPLQILYGAGNR